MGEDKQYWKIVSSGLNLTIIISAGLIYEAIAAWLNGKENHRTSTEYNDNLIIKNFLFQFVNNYFILFYIAYLRQIEFGGVKKQCLQSCLGELQMQMLIVFTGKTFGLQFVELAKPFAKKKVALVLEMSSFKKMKNNVSQVSNLGLTAVGLGEPDKDEVSKAKEEQRLADAHSKAERSEVDTAAAGMTDPYEIQTHMVNYEDKGTFDDFNEMAIQYGYIALFSPCFPLAPFFALLNNVFEIRGDAWKLCKGYQRPTAAEREDIGSWFTVLNFIGFVAVMTNATMIAFVGSQAAKPGHEKMSIQNRFGAAHLWYQAVGIEHGVMLTRIFLLIFLPTYPNWISDARDVLRFRISEIRKSYQTQSEINKMQTLKSMGASEENASEFIRADIDNDDRLTREEYTHRFGRSAEEFDKADKNHDGTVGAREFALDGLLRATDTRTVNKY